MYTTRKILSEKLSAQVDQLRIIDELHTATTPENVVSAFEVAGIFHQYDISMTNFNQCMPTVKVIKEKSRFRKSNNYLEEKLLFRVNI